LGVAAAVATGLFASPGYTGAEPRASGTTGPYYVAIGASESLGVQPVASDHRDVPTNEGYADDLSKMEQSRWPGLRLVGFGCPGITAQGALDGQGTCRYAAGSEVATAVRFIGDHRGQVALVTVDLGFNDVWPCLVHRSIDAACVGRALHRISVAVPAILAALRAAGGPNLLIVGLEHADPYVAAARFGAEDFARASVSVFERMNELLASDYGAADAAVASVSVPRGESAGPDAVAAACERTWMCSDRNIHPTDAGYRVIAHAVALAIARAQASDIASGS
jgi:lysophospholipase L1-like esterase